MAAIISTPSSRPWVASAGLALRNAPRFVLNDRGVGPSLLGPGLRGPSLPGPSLLGPSLLGPSLLGPSLLGPSLLRPSLRGSSLRGEAPRVRKPSSGRRREIALQLVQDDPFQRVARVVPRRPLQRTPGVGIARVPAMAN